MLYRLYVMSMRMMQESESWRVQIKIRFFIARHRYVRICIHISMSIDAYRYRRKIRLATEIGLLLIRVIEVK